MLIWASITNEEEEGLGTLFFFVLGDVISLILTFIAIRAIRIGRNEEFGFRRETRSSRMLRGMLTWAAICKAGGAEGRLGYVVLLRSG